MASLLGKVHISPGSSEDRLREAYTEVSCAVDDGVATDAPSRNALYKVHVSLGKIVNTLDESQPANLRASSRSVSVATDTQGPEEKTVVGESSIPEEEEEQTAILKQEHESVGNETATSMADDTQIQT